MKKRSILERLARERGLTLSEISRKTGFTRPTIYNYLRYPDRIRYKNAEVMRKFFGLSHDDWANICSPAELDLLIENARALLANQRS